MKIQNLAVKIAVTSWVVGAITLVIFLIIGCSSAPVNSPSVSRVTGHIDKAYNDLSASDSKAVLIESWIK